MLRPMANKDRDEFYVLDICDEVLGIEGVRGYRFDWLLGDLSVKTGSRTRLPVDAFWADLALVVEFRERQHYESVAIFDKPDVMTVSGVHRGEQRRVYDRRRDELIPGRGLTLAVMRTTDFKVSRRRIDRDRVHDIEVVRELLSAAGVGSSPTGV